MKHKKYKDKSKHERKKSKKKEKKKHKNQKYSESDSSSSSSEEGQQWVEKIVPQSSGEQNIPATTKELELPKREDWMNMKSIFPCVFNEKTIDSANSSKDTDRPDLDKLGQSDKELNPYWKNGGSGLPEQGSMKTHQVTNVTWLKKSLQRAKEQAERENRSLKEIAAERWGSLEVIQSMISEAENNISRGNKSKYSNKSREKEKYGHNRQSPYAKYSDKDDKYKRYDDLRHENRQKQKYKKPTEDDCFSSSSYKSNFSGKKKWQKGNISTKIEENKSSLDTSELKSSSTNDTNDMKNEEIKPLTEAEMNKLGAKIVKAEIMGDTELAEELKLQLNKAREVARNNQTHGTEKVQSVVLTRTDTKGNVRPLEPRNTETRHTKRKVVDTYDSGKKMRHYFDDDKYSLQQLFQKEKGRSVNEDNAEFVKAASKNMDMDELFEQNISRVKSAEKQNERDRSLAIKEHKRLTKSLDNCRWCIDSKYMLKHLIVSVDSEICLSLPQYTSLTDGHCIITPVNHVACQLQLDEDVWQRLKMYKKVLYKMFMDQNQYPVFYEVYKSRHKFPHMQLECIPLPKEVGELAPMYFKKALLECETEWSMNKKVINLENKDVRQVIPNGLSYFMVEFETNKGYAHVIEEEHLFPKNFAEEIIGGMLDLDHDMWRKPRRENFDQQSEKVLKFSDVWNKYELEVKTYD